MTETACNTFRGTIAVWRERCRLGSTSDPRRISRFSATKASVMTVHLCSTVPMGADPARAGVDSGGRVHGLVNVRVNDASILPTAPGVNPQGTVMALAIRNAQRFAAARRSGG